LRYILLTYIITIQWAAGQVSVREDSLFSSSLNAMSKYTVILPSAYAANHERYPILYLLHGLGGDQSNWVTLTKLVSYAGKYSIIIVCPDGRNGWYSNSTLKRDANYEDQIMKDLVPHVEEKYRVIRSKFYRGVAGLSMGGYGAVKFGLKYPGSFSFAAGISPSVQFPAGLEDSVIVARWSRTSTTNLRELFGSRRMESWNNDDIFYLIERANPSVMPYFYLSIGSQDGIIELPEMTHQLATVLRKQKIPFEMHELQGAHNWKFWDSEIEIVLQRFNEKIGKR
jgi:putative tributyrin esterase